MPTGARAPGPMITVAGAGEVERRGMPGGVDGSKPPPPPSLLPTEELRKGKGGEPSPRYPVLGGEAYGWWGYESLPPATASSPPSSESAVRKDPSRLMAAPASFRTREMAAAVPAARCASVLPGPIVW